MSDLKKLGLHDLHLSLGGKMVPFAGYEMPVQYPLGVMKEHLHTRTSAGLFDVSHMGQAVVKTNSDWATPSARSIVAAPAQTRRPTVVTTHIGRACFVTQRTVHPHTPDSCVWTASS